MFIANRTQHYTSHALRNVLLTSHSKNRENVLNKVIINKDNLLNRIVAAMAWVKYVQVVAVPKGNCLT